MATTPAQLQEQLTVISDKLYEVSQEAATIAGRSGTAWLELRKTCKTNAEADHIFAATPDGSRMAYLKYYIRGLQAKRGAIKMEIQSNSGSSW